MNKRGILQSKAIAIIFVIIFSLFYISFLAVDVRAINTCCEKTIAGDYCQYTNEENCDLSVRQVNAVSSCEQTSYCQIGCCYGIDGAGCQASTSKATCEAKDGIFSTDASCNSIAECRQICCQLGNECQLTTQDACQDLGSSLGITPAIKDANTESQCLSYCQLEESGCCTSQSSCSYIKGSECSAISGSFNPGRFCSSISTCSQCEPRSYKSCVPGEDDVYWFDSCGNREGTAEDCSYLDGTICGDVDGDVQCKSIDCQVTIDDPNIDRDGGNRKNGESWCGYEGATGAGKDLVGSRQYRHTCVNGEEIIEPCADFRQEYCVQGDLELNGETFSEAFCVPNKGDECVNDCNTGDLNDDKKCCEQNPSCFWTGNSNAGSCLPIVPRGSRFWEGENEDICATANQDITVYWQKETFASSWDCEGNCQVINDPNFAEKFNSYCAALGDCGAYYNYVGAFTQDGYECDRSGGNCRGRIHDDRFDLANINKAYYGSFESLRKANGLEFEKLVINDPSVKLPLTINMMSRVFLFGLSGLALSSFGGDIVAKYGEKIAVAAVTVSYALVQLGLVSGPVGWVIAGVGIVILVLSLTGDEDDTTFSFSCEPWQAPAGGKDCSKCGADPLHPCTEYKCKSLGQNCEYIFENEGTSRETCYDINPNDINSPILKAMEGSLDVREDINGYFFTEPVPANKKLNFGFTTNELAQCKYSSELNIAFDDKEAYFGSSFYSTTHNITITPLSGQEYSYNIRCQDKSGNKNQRDYTVSFSASRGPDLTPPAIEHTSPRQNGFVVNGITNITADIFLNEQSSCRWHANDVAYESMSGSFNCLVSQNPGSALFKCQASLPFKEPSSTYYIRCKDLANNTNTQGYPYFLKGTQPLVITSKKPEGKIVGKEQSIEIVTAGGAESGKSVCRFSPGDLPFSAMIDFFSTNSTSHTQKLALDSGSYNYNVKCMDVAGNEAKSSLVFTVEIDNLQPRITRIYKDSSSLTLILNEPTICEYSANQFTFGSGTNMPADNSITHTAPLLSSYFVECRDLSGNSFGMVKIYP